MTSQTCPRCGVELLPLSGDGDGNGDGNGDGFPPSFNAPGKEG